MTYEIAGSNVILSLSADEMNEAIKALAENNRMPVVSQTSFLYEMSKATFHKQRDRESCEQKQLRKLVRVSVHPRGEKGILYNTQQGGC